MPFEVLGRVGQRMTFLVGLGSPNGKGLIFFGGRREGIRERNVMYKKHV